MHYRAFLSYSHADEKSARWLMRRLEAYRVPKNLVGMPGRDGPIPAKLGQMFRDRDELPSAGDLSSTITAALNDSSALVVICSPASAQSRWVNAEVQAFRASGRGDFIYSFIIGGDPASREPGMACFPASLIEPENPDGPEREPLAADARKEGDGRERAFLKLVAGLLGVGFNDLAQREAQQRHRRMAIITGASLAGMALAIALAVTAYVARNDAERRQAQAEDILGFMLGDLRKNLTKVGRLDLMRSVDDKATGYFATLDPRDLSDRALEEQARSLTGIGEVRVNEGKNAEAMAAFLEAHERTSALYLRQPENGQRLFDLAQTEYWIGYVAWQQARYDDARLWLTKYRDSSIKLAAMDRSNFAWQKEAAYGYQNLAVLDESLGKYDEAERAMLAQKELRDAWVRQYPKDVELRFAAANIDSWLGSLALRKGRLEQAESYFNAQLAAMASNMAEDPGNAKWKELRVDAALFLLGIQLQLGKRQDAERSLAQAMPIAESLHAQDPKNSVWLASLADCHLRHAELSSDMPEAHLDKAMALIQKALELDPKNEGHTIFLARLWSAKAQKALAEDGTSAAHAFAGRSIQLIKPFWLASRSEDQRMIYARALIMQGEIFHHEGDRIQAEKSLRMAVDLLTESTGGELPFMRLDSLVRAMKLLGQEKLAEPYLKQLVMAGFVPLTPWP